MIIKADIQLKKDINILDFGCGPGNNFPFLLKNNPKLIVAVDLSEEMLKQAKLKGLGDGIVIYVIASFQDYKTTEKFDFIPANLSLVHLPKDELLPVLNKVNKMLTGDGLFFANYFEGNDETKLLTSEWGKQKYVKRYFCFYKLPTLKKYYKGSGLKIIKSFKKTGRSFTRINILSERV